MEFFDLTWHRNRSGYVWREIGEEQCLVDNLAPPEILQGKRRWAPLATVMATCMPRVGEQLVQAHFAVDPMTKPKDLSAAMGELYASYNFSLRAQNEEPAFAQLARTEPTLAAIQTFADSFGPLGTSDAITLFKGEDARGEFVCLPAWTIYHFGMYRPESLARWQAEIYRIRDTLSLWKAVVERDGSFLRAQTRIHDKDVVYISPSTGKVARHHALQAPLPSRIPKAEAAGNFLVAELVGQPDVPFIDELIPTLTNDRRTSGSFKRRFRINNLRDAIWTELKQAISRELRFLGCRSCHKWIRIAKESRRTNSRYCNDACRQAGCRERRHTTAADRERARAALPRWQTVPQFQK